MFSSKRKEHWVAVAAREFHRIQTRWGLSSRREIARLLHINARTLAKLDCAHPDPTLSIESVIRIYNSLFLLVPYEFRASAQKEEKEFIEASRHRVLMSYARPSQLLLDELQALDAGK
jgi:hypothetical protein